MAEAGGASAIKPQPDSRKPNDPPIYCTEL